MKLVGLCNQCGLCCIDGDLSCIHLEVIDEIGKPKATYCKIYNKRTPQMIIFLVNKQGVIESIGNCTFANPEVEMKEIMEKGIGKGCSLTVEA